jgi:predicted ester cyclase
MTEAALADLYRAYIACLNRQDWENLHRFVADDARHNGRPFGLAGYRAIRALELRDDSSLKISNVTLRAASKAIFSMALRRS